MSKKINDGAFWDRIDKNTNKIVNERWKENSGSEKKTVKRSSKKK
ncbi:MAG: hypothetical protein ACFN3H_05670 [Spirochaetales bacterium]